MASKISRNGAEYKGMIKLEVISLFDNKNQDAGAQNTNHDDKIEQMKKCPHLVQYQGSKRNLAPIIVKYFPKEIKRLIEPFSGTAALSIYSAYNGLADSFLLNDINSAVIKLLEKCVTDPDALVEEYKKIWTGQFADNTDSNDYYYKMRELFNKGNPDEALTLFILARVAKGAIRYNLHGEMNQICDKRRFGTKPENVLENACAISYLLKNRTEFYNTDYKDVLKMAKKGDLVYMDPPYQGVISGLSQRYISGLDFDEFVDSLSQLNKRNVDYIVSYDGQTGDKKFGQDLPESLELQHVLINAGRSSQATLNGKVETTYESLYISKGIRKDL